MTARIKVLIATLAVVLVASVVAQTTGVLAAWNDRVFGKSEFGADTSAPVPVGFARGMAANGEFAFSQGLTNGIASIAVKSNNSVGATTDSGSFSISGNPIILGDDLFHEATGNTAARYDPYTGGAVNASSTLSTFQSRIQALGLPVATRVQLSESISTSVTCPRPGQSGSPTFTAPTGGVIQLQNASLFNPWVDIPIPAANQSSAMIDSSPGTNRTLRGQLHHVRSTVNGVSKSSLTLFVENRRNVPSDQIWSYTVVLVSAECSNSQPVPVMPYPAVKGLGALAGRAMAVNPDDETPSSSSSEVPAAYEDSEGSAAASESADPDDPKDEDDASTPSESEDVTDEDAKNEDSDSTDGDTTDGDKSDGEKSDGDTTTDEEGDESESSTTAPSTTETPKPSGPTSPVAVQVGSRFDMRATDGSDLGSAIIHEVDRAPHSDGTNTVSVRMTLDTAGAGEDRRIGSLSADEFRQMVGGQARPLSTTSATGSPSLGGAVSPGQSYSGWMTFIVSDDATGLMFRPDGSAGWFFSLPAAPPTPTSTAAPAPAATKPAAPKPESSAPAPAPTSSAPAAVETPEAAQESSTPERSDPEPTGVENE